MVSGGDKYWNSILTKRLMNRLLPIQSKQDILSEYRDTPIGLLLEYHNLNRPFEIVEKAQLLVGMCMDNRKHLHMPDNFAFIIRSGGANLRYSEFKVSYAIAVGQIRHIALIGHNNCGMVDLVSRKREILSGSGSTKKKPVKSRCTRWEPNILPKLFG